MAPPRDVCPGRRGAPRREDPRVRAPVRDALRPAADRGERAGGAADPARGDPRCRAHGRGVAEHGGLPDDQPVLDDRRDARGRHRARHPAPVGRPGRGAGRVRDLLAHDHADRRRPRPALRAAAPGAARGSRDTGSRCARSRCLRPAPGRRRSRRSVVGGPRRGRWWRRASDVRDLDEQRGAVHLDQDVLAVLLAVLLPRAVPAPGEQRADDPAVDPGAERDTDPSGPPARPRPAAPRRPEAPSSGTTTSPSGDAEG